MDSRGFLVRQILIRSKNQDGQVAFEFLLVFAFALGITFMFVYMSTNFVAGYLAHYATFMASRTFLTADDGGRNVEAVFAFAENRARDKFATYPLHFFNMDPAQLKIERPGAGKKAIFVGATFKFRKLLSPMKAIGGQERATFFTESFLGKEPTRRTCYDQVCAAIGQQQCSMEMDVTLFDNGC